MIKKIIRFIIFFLLIGLFSFSLFVIAVNYEVFGHLYTKKELKEFKNQTATLVYSSDHVLLGKYFSKNRTNVKFNQIPTHVVNALVATEDVRFFEHEGVDSRSLIRVLFKTILLNQASSGGGSTITQQLLKNMYGRKRFGPLTMLVNKTKEALLAYRLENVYNKEEILALYLNTIPFGENVYGIASASRLYFNKSITEISVDQGAVLIGMLKANTYYNPRLYPNHAFDRRNVVFKQMMKNDYLTQTAYDSLIELPILLDYANLSSSGPANYFMVQVKKELKTILDDIKETTGKNWDFRTDGLVVETTLDHKLQMSALYAFKMQLVKMQSRLRKQYKGGSSKRSLDKRVNTIVQKEGLNKSDIVQREVFAWDSTYYDSVSVFDSIALSLTTLHAGFLAIHPITGNVLAWVGGIDFRTQPYDQVLAKRQVASTFKPILYAAALEKGMSPCDYLENTAQIYTDFDNWKPANYDHSEGGEYSLTGALIKSKNIPAVNLLYKVGYDEVDYLWRKMGFTSTLKYTPSMALGTVNASLYEIAKAYSAFSNGGYELESNTIKSIKTADGEILFTQKNDNRKEQILESKTSMFMNEMLQKAIDHGTGTSIRSKYNLKTPLAGKTGTSQNYSDAWFVAYNPGIVMVTRVGASSPNIHFNSGANGAGGRLALPITALTLQQIENDVGMKEKYDVKFEVLPRKFESEFACIEFKEDTAIDKFKDLFKSKKTTSQKKSKKSKKEKKKKKSWFKRKNK